MTDIARLTVEYRSTGYDKVKGEVESLTRAGSTYTASNQRVGASVDRLKTRMGGLEREARNLAGVFKHAFGGLIAFGAVASLAEFAKSIGEANVEMQRIRFTLDAATGSMKNANREFAFVSTVSNKLGLGLQETAQGYARLAASALGAGLSTRELHEGFEALAGAFTVLHAPAQEVNRVLVQLDQGFSLGRIQMRDLRAISNSMPAVLEMVSKGLAQTGHNMADMLAHGGIPAQLFFQIFTQELRDKFGPAVSEASNSLNSWLNRLHNTMFQIKADPAIVESLRDAIKGLVQTLQQPATMQGIEDAVKGMVSAFRGAIGVAAQLLKMLPELIAGLKALAIVMGTRLLTGTILRLTEAMKAQIAITAVYSITTRRLAVAQTAANLAGRGFAGVMALLGSPVGIAALAIGGLAYAIHVQKTQQDAAEKSVTALNDALGKLPGTTGEANTKALEFARTQEKLARNTLAATRAQLAQLIAQQQAAEQAAKRLQPASQMFGGRADSRMGASYAQTWASQTASLIDKRRQDIEKLQKAIKAAQLAIANNDPALIAGLGARPPTPLPSAPTGITTKAYDNAANYQRTVAELQKQAHALDGIYNRNRASINGVTEAEQRFNDRMSGANQLLQAGRIGWEQYNRIAADALDNLNGKGKTTFDTLYKGFSTLTQTMGSAMMDVVDRISGTLAELVVTGKANFKSLTRGILEMIAQLIIKFLILRAVMALVDFVAPGSQFGQYLHTQAGFAKGGVFDRNGVMAFANGGIVNRPTMFQYTGGRGVMGEAGPEAIMPLTRGPNGRLGVQAHGGRRIIVNNSWNIDARGAGPDEIAKLAQMREQTVREVYSGVAHYDKYGYFPSPA